MLFTRILIGTSGWDYEDWIGSFYTSERNLFSQYTRVFNTVEVNSTFYSLPSPRFMERLFQTAPRGFVFSVKMYRGITHKKLLNPRLAVGELEAFFKALEPARRSGKLGAVLIQLPPRGLGEVPWFRDFLEALPKGYRYAVEFRDRSWLREEVYRILADLNVAYTIVDEPLIPPEIVVTADFAYVRWHGRGGRPWYYYHYQLEELKEWVPRLQKLTENVNLILGYFNNHFRGFAPHNALQMLALLGMLDRDKRLALERMDKYFSSAPRDKIYEAKAALSEGGIESTLLALAGEKRFSRALEISDGEVRYSLEGKHVSGRVKEYIVVVDVERRRILHDCEDWRKSLETKRFCKHMVKFFLALPREVALTILNDLTSNIDEWEFEAGSAAEGE